MLQFMLARLARAVALQMAAILLAPLLAAAGYDPLAAGGAGLARGYGYAALAAVRGDLGVSLHGGQRVADVVGDGIAASAELFGTAVVLMLLLGPALGLLLAAVRRHWAADFALPPLRALAAQPSFLIACVLAVPIALTATDWPLSDSDGRTLVALAGVVALLPTLALALRLHDGIVAADGAGYACYARARGLPAGAVFGHLALNAARGLADTLAALGGGLLAGCAMVEAVFERPGLGATLIEAASAGDGPTLAAGLPVAVAAALAIGWCAEVLRHAADPRLLADAAPPLAAR